MSLKGKVALVTGSTSGIGLGIALALAQAGADIMLNGLPDAAAADAAIQKVTAYGVRAGFSAADLSTSAGARDLVRATHDELGGCDILVNNAGIQHVAPIAEFPDDKWDLILSLMLTAPFQLVKAAAPAMQAKKWGRIINISSAHGKVASARKSAYVAAKHGLVGFNKVTALEYAGTGVTSNCICPGWVLTPLVQQQIDALAAHDNLDANAAKSKLVLEKQPSGDFATPDQIGQLALFLCSDAASQITGTEISIDGGWTAQ
ncbi:MAG: 3-hydroxybutyrate dehydrogenase [Pseudomonadota bacterium]